MSLADMEKTFFVPYSRNTLKVIKLISTVVNGSLFYCRLIARKSQLLFINRMMKFPAGSFELKKYLYGGDSYNRAGRKVGVVWTVPCTHGCMRVYSLLG